MSLDITLLRVLREREKYLRLERVIPWGALDAQIAVILKDYGCYFREHEALKLIEPGPFMLWFKGFKHKNLKPEAVAIFDGLLRRIEQPLAPGIEEGMIARLVAADKADKITKIIEDWNTDGSEIDLLQALKDQVDAYEIELDRKVKNPQCLTPIEDILKADENDEGLHFRLPCLNRTVRPLRSGDFVVVAARPDKGKTSFAASELTFMAGQLPLLFPEERRDILWFNNEGPGDRIVQRNFQAALGITLEEMIALNNLPAPEGSEKYRTKLRAEYAAALGGRPGALRVFDIHDMWNHEVEAIIQLYKPGLILFDMIDNIKFGGAAANNGQRTDQILEEMYKWARLMAVKYQSPVMAMSQLSADADGITFPTLPQLKDSKTGKQGAADLIITLGAVNEPALENSRYIGTTKNKLRRTGMPGSPRQEVQFQGDRSRYVENQA